MRFVAAFLLCAGVAHAHPAGVESEKRAHMNWMLQCQGCHQPDATGSANGAPNMAGEVARFLGVEGGREYLMRVPGVANAGLSNDQLAELLNWVLATYDATHLPNDFVPYTAEEIGVARKNVLISGAPVMRESLIEAMYGDVASEGR